MKRFERTQILVEGNSELVRELAVEIEGKYLVEILDEPHEELVMVQVRESAQNSLFYLGEALMCSCCVRLADATGLGFILGSRRDMAYNLALVDAAFSVEDSSGCKQVWEAKIAKEEARLRAKREKEQQLVERTRVDFSTMESDEL